MTGVSHKPRLIDERGGKIAYSKSTSTPSATAVDLLQVGEHREDGLVAERDVDEAVVGEGAHGGNGSRLLATTKGTGGNKETGVLAPVAARGPDTTGPVPEGLPLSGEVTVASGDTEKDGVVVLQSVDLDDGVRRLRRSVHPREDVIGKSLSDPKHKYWSITERLEYSPKIKDILVDVGLATS